MEVQGKREILAEVNEDMFFLDPSTYDEALVGYAYRFGILPVAAYDESKILQILQADGMSLEDAFEYFDYKIMGAQVGESTPIFITFLENVYGL